MKAKKTSAFILLFFMGIFTYSSQEKIDYKNLFRNVKNYISAADFQIENAQLVEDKQQYASLLEKGLNSFNVLAPYTQMEKDLKGILSDLTNFKFTLRSAQSTKVYQEAVNSTVLIIAPELGSGAGFVIDKSQGLIVTNFHVTSGLRNLLVAFHDPNIQDLTKLKFHSASVVKYSAKRDIAVLKLASPPSNLQELSFEDIEKLNVGEDIHTIGHPLLLTWTYSHGLITSIRNKFRFGEEEIANVVQIDANISPGNSGGPLLNNNGNVVGMVTFSNSSQYAQNLNFAISGNEIKSLLVSNKNEDTSVSKALQKLYESKLFSLLDVFKDCEAYRVDEDKDGMPEGLIFLDKKTQQQKYLYIIEVEIEIETGEKKVVNILSMDISDDGVTDVYFIDYNLDEIFDSIMIDIDFDGYPDIVGKDSESKGYITEAWIL